MPMRVMTPPNTDMMDTWAQSFDCSPCLLTAFITFDFHHSLVMKLLPIHFVDSQNEAQTDYAIAQGRPVSNSSSPT